jgi:N-sulfoglucosamine sulfohydrolase
VDAPYQMLPELLRENGYLTGCINKPRDSSITDDYEKYWDYSQILKGPDKRGAVTYKQYVDTFLEKAEAAGVPFFCVVNIADPHKPFFNDPKGTKQGFDKFAPSRFYSAEEVPIPGFLFEHPAVRKEGPQLL